MKKVYPQLKAERDSEGIEDREGRRRSTRRLRRRDDLAVRRDEEWRDHSEDSDTTISSDEFDEGSDGRVGSSDSEAEEQVARSRRWAGAGAKGGKG